MTNISTDIYELVTKNTIVFLYEMIILHMDNQKIGF